MSEIFWASTQRARREYRCDYCFEFIEIGQVYRRHAWVPRTGVFHVMREHEEPGCPREYLEHQREPVLMGVPVALAVEQRTVLRLGRDGKTIAESEPHIVPRLVCEEISTPDEEIPF